VGAGHRIDPPTVTRQGRGRARRPSIAPRDARRGQSPARTAAAPDAATETVSVVGPLCTPLDRLADRATLPVAQVGDLVAVFMAGAYGMTASPTAFLGHPAPRELLVGKATGITRHS